METIALIWVAFTSSFTLGWIAHARVVKARGSSSPRGSSGIEKPIDLTAIERDQKVRNKKAG